MLQTVSLVKLGIWCKCFKAEVNDEITRYPWIAVIENLDVNKCIGTFQTKILKEQPIKYYNFWTNPTYLYNMNMISIKSKTESNHGEGITLRHFLLIMI